MIRHDPPLIYDVQKDPFELYPLHTYLNLTNYVREIVRKHKATIVPVPEQLQKRNANVTPCCNPPHCRCDLLNESDVELPVVIRRAKNHMHLMTDKEESSLLGNNLFQTMDDNFSGKTLDDGGYTMINTETFDQYLKNSVKSNIYSNKNNYESFSSPPFRSSTNSRLYNWEEQNKNQRIRNYQSTSNFDSQNSLNLRSNIYLSRRDSNSKLSFETESGYIYV